MFSCTGKGAVPDFCRGSRVGCDVNGNAATRLPLQYKTKAPPDASGGALK
jgi:hypothetical protein